MHARQVIPVVVGIVDKDDVRPLFFKPVILPVYNRDIRREQISFNTHLSYFPAGSQYVDYYGYDFAKRYHEQLMKDILNRPE